MPQLAVTLDLDGLDAERVEEACLGLGALAVSYTDQHDDPILEPAPGEFRLWPHSRLQALFSFDCKPQEIVAGLEHVLRLAPGRISVETLADRMWEREWLRDFHPMCFGKRLWVAPHHSHVHTPGAVIVRLDPGLAFGTGTHPTTALCLGWLDQNVRDGQLVIDYGCGSGVLAVAAVKLGARAAHAFDIDPQALTATRDNADANQVADRVHVAATDAELPVGADILLANILCGPLCELAPRFAALTCPGGQIVLAGLLATQADEVTRAHAAWFDIAPFATRDGWTALAGTRNRQPASVE
ncbi:MAG TPA: 50S ribosomal protein L11 methyltransferase [Steroidobacteraceae bacterium]|nr:50S ribosomal protein L11 methyltransferase [Steroidobacteraceae bacterium]